MCHHKRKDKGRLGCLKEAERVRLQYKLRRVVRVGLFEKRVTTLEQRLERCEGIHSTCFPFFLASKIRTKFVSQSSRGPCDLQIQGLLSIREARQDSG